MNQIPSMWRVELFHPLTVHLPLGLLLTAVVLRCLGLTFARRPWGDFLLSASKLMTVLGTAAAWGAYVTGGWAEEEVNSYLCDPTQTHLHEDYALYTSVLFSVVAVGDLAGALVKRARAFTGKTAVQAVLCVLALAGGGLIAYTGHLGAALVYQQGAGVYKPSPQCTEFEE